MTREEIKSWLDDGDYIKIARRCTAKGRQTTRQYVSNVMNGHCNSVKGTGKMIMEEAELVAMENKLLREQADSQGIN